MACVVLLLLFWDDGEEGQRLCAAGVDERVTMPLGAIVALAGGEAFLAVIKEAVCFAANDEDNLAVGSMAVEAYRAAHVEPSTHNLVRSVVERTEHRVTQPAFELRVGDFCYFVKVDNHSVCIVWWLFCFV